MRRTWPASSLCALLASTVLLAGEPIFVPVKIDGPKHDPERPTYWYGPSSECASVADFDRDGDLDIAAGRHWYEAPGWKKHEDFRDGANDIVVAGKGGLYIFYHAGTAPRSRPPHRLPPEDTYPSWIPWHKPAARK